jgi:uncharacterized protein YigE (DUF2233 family)
MKRIFSIFIILIFLTFAGFTYFKNPIPKKSSPNVLSAIEKPTVSPSAWKQSVIIDVNDIPIRVSWVKVNPEEAKLYSNLKEQKLSEEIKVNNNCSILVNGGFYSKENTHLGLFITNFEKTSPFQANPTLNGFLWISDNSASITNTPPNTNPRIALQSGPLLMQDKNPLTLDIKDDEPSRRVVAATTADNKLIFLVFYRDLANFEGPMLEHLPKVLNLFQKQTNIDLVDAINLDGGSASVFISNYDRLNELTRIGSYFCIK